MFKQFHYNINTIPSILLPLFGRGLEALKQAQFNFHDHLHVGYLLITN